MSPPIMGRVQAAATHVASRFSLTRTDARPLLLPSRPSEPDSRSQSTLRLTPTPSALPPPRLAAVALSSLLVVLHSPLTPAQHLALVFSHGGRTRPRCRMGRRRERVPPSLPSYVPFQRTPIHAHAHIWPHAWLFSPSVPLSFTRTPSPLTYPATSYLQSGQRRTRPV